MKPIAIKSLCCMLAAVLFAACGVQMGDDSARTPVTGSAGGQRRKIPMRNLNTAINRSGLWR